MAKPVGELIQDYVDARLGCGGFVMAVGGVIAAIYLIPRMFKKMLEYFKESWAFWLLVVLVLIVGVLAFVVWYNSKKNGQKKGGCVFVVGGVSLFVLAFSYFSSGVFGSILLGVSSIVLALLFVGLGCYLMITQEE